MPAMPPWAELVGLVTTPLVLALAVKLHRYLMTRPLRPVEDPHPNCGMCGTADQVSAEEQRRLLAAIGFEGEELERRVILHEGNAPPPPPIAVGGGQSNEAFVALVKHTEERIAKARQNGGIAYTEFDRVMERFNAEKEERTK